MITLKNVRNEGNKIVVDCYPESEKRAIKVSVADSDFDSFEFSPIEAEKEWRQHLNHARKVLISMANGNVDLEDGVIMWY